MKLGSTEVPVSQIMQFGALVAMLWGALAWADSRYASKDAAIQMQRNGIETQLEILDEKIYRAKKNNEMGRAAELQRRYDLKLKELDRLK